MAKRIGVLEPDDPFTSDPACCSSFVSKSVARLLVRRALAVKVAPRVIQKIRTLAAKAADVVKTSVSTWWDGPIGIGNALPFAKVNNSGDRLHYEIPRAGDRGIFARHRRKLIHVSGRLAPELRIA